MGYGCVGMVGEGCSGVDDGGGVGAGLRGMRICVLGRGEGVEGEGG